MSPWPTDGHWGGRRSAAVNYVSDSNSAPLPVGWDWAARSSEFVAPKPLIRPIPNNIPAPIPAIAGAGKRKPGVANYPGRAAKEHGNLGKKYAGSTAFE